MKKSLTNASYRMPRGPAKALNALPYERPRIAFQTLGCAKNEVDSATMEKALVRAGFEVTDEVGNADVIIVNTCSFIQAATEESLEAIFDLVQEPRVVSGACKLIIAGCMPSRYGADLERELQEATAFVPCSREDDIAAVVCQALCINDTSEWHLGKSLGNNAECKSDDDYEFDDSGTRSECVGARETGFEGDTQAANYATGTDGADNKEDIQHPAWCYVKISDGCDRRCSYCTIPSIRGAYRSFSYEEILAEVTEQVQAGVREINLIAQDTGRWGKDFPESLSLSWLLDNLANSFPTTWFRVLYLQPEGVSDELLGVMAQHSNICRYFDIPLQHCDSSLLRAMNRRGSRKTYEALLNHIADRLPNVTLRTTLIVGFPGETYEQFEELCDFVASYPFDYVGIFPYSREEGTTAFDLPDQIDYEEKIERAQTLRDLADAVCTRRIAQRIGKVYDVLIEGADEDGRLFGRSREQAPEVDGVTFVNRGKPGQVLSVLIEDMFLYDQEGVVINDDH